MNVVRSVNGYGHVVGLIVRWSQYSDRRKSHFLYCLKKNTWFQSVDYIGYISNSIF